MAGLKGKGRGTLHPVFHSLPFREVEPLFVNRRSSVVLNSLLQPCEVRLSKAAARAAAIR